MGVLDELACLAHQGGGYTSGCPGCELSVQVASLRSVQVASLRSALASTNVGTTFTPVVLLIQAPPTIARKAYYALGKAVSGAELTAGERDLLQTMRDMFQDCVEKLRR